MRDDFTMHKGRKSENKPVFSLGGVPPVQPVVATTFIQPPKPAKQGEEVVSLKPSKIVVGVPSEPEKVELPPVEPPTITELPPPKRGRLAKKQEEQLVEKSDE